MKLYIKGSRKYVDSLMDRLYHALGIGQWSSNYRLSSVNDGKHNFKISRDYYALDNEEIAKFKSRIKSIGGKYIEVKRGVLYFYFDLNTFKADYDRESQEADEAYSNELNGMDIDQFKPSQAIIKKLIDYRDRGSKVNVKAIKDRAKLITYFYGACLIGWGDLAYDCQQALSWDDRDLLEAITRRVKSDESYADTRTEMEKRLDIPDSKGLFTFESKSCWVPKKLLQFFINNNIPVDFGKRTSGAQFDRNGRQWSEIEHLKIHRDDGDIVEYDLVVHTDEGGGPHTYTGFGPNGRTAERTSVKNIIEDIQTFI